MFHYFTIKFHFSFFTSFCFFSLRSTLVVFASKWNKAKRNSSLFFRFFSLFCFFFTFFRIFFTFFRFFRFTFFALLRFSDFCFEVKQSEAKFKYFFSLFSLFSLFFAFFHFFWAFFRLIFVSLRFFRLIFAYVTFILASDFWGFTSKWIMWNQAFFSLPSETKFSLQFQISLPKRKWGRTLNRIEIVLSHRPARLHSLAELVPWIDSWAP